MERTQGFVVALGVLVIAGMTGIGYWLGNRIEQGGARSSPTPAAKEAASLTTPGVAATEIPAASPPVGQRGSKPAPAPSPRPPPAAAPVKLVLDQVPASVESGSTIAVRWSVQGPAGTRGSSTRLRVKLGGSKFTSTEKTAFALPATFEATVKASGSGTLHLTVEATVNGETLRAEQTIEVR